MDNRNLILGALAFMILLVSASGVLAWGISSPYSDKFPLELEVGESREVSFVLVNGDGEGGTADVVVNLEAGTNIAEITSGERYSVSIGERKAIMLRVSIPERASVGDDYRVEFSVVGAPEDEGGNIEFGVKYGVDFPVKVVEESIIPEEALVLEETTEESSSIIVWVLVVVVIIIILFVLFRKRK
jgi:hypothetical protein